MQQLTWEYWQKSTSLYLRTIDFNLERITFRRQRTNAFRMLLDLLLVWHSVRQDNSKNKSSIVEKRCFICGMVSINTRHTGCISLLYASWANIVVTFCAHVADCSSLANINNTDPSLSFACAKLCITNHIDCKHVASVVFLQVELSKL